MTIAPAGTTAPVEIRIADVCLDVRDTVLLAALSRALVDTAAADVGEIVRLLRAWLRSVGKRRIEGVDEKLAWLIANLPKLGRGVVGGAGDFYKGWAKSMGLEV